MIRLGGQVVTFVTVTEDPDNRDRYNSPARVRTETPVRGCLFRPMTAEEKVALGYNAKRSGDTDVVTDPWKCTAPPVAAVMNAKAGDEIKVGGVVYQITGLPRVFPSLSGRAFKVTVICERKIA